MVPADFVAGICVEDLISIGTIGLIKGINTFNGERGTRLATYAARCIENTILTLRLFFQKIKKKAYRFQNRRRRGPVFTRALPSSARRAKA